MFTQSDLKKEKNNVNLHLKLHIVHDIPHCKFYLKNNTHSSLSRKSEETMMVSSLPQKACLQTVLSMLSSTKPHDQLLISSFSIPVNSLWLIVNKVNCNAQDKHWKVKKILHLTKQMVGVIAIETERMKIHFLSDVFVATPSWYLKLPITLLISLFNLI